MKKIYIKNLNYLDNSIKNEVISFKISRILEKVKAKTGKLTLRINLNEGKSLFLHSQYNPKKEAERFIDNYNLEEVNSVVLVGFGLGYIVKELLLKMDVEQNLKVIIPNVDIFKIALQSRDLTDILSDNRLELILAKNYPSLIEKLQKLFDSISILDNKLIYYHQAVKVIPQEFRDLKDILEGIKLSHQNSNQYSDNINDNIIDNLRFINESIGVKNFKGFFNEKPIFIVSAGPSLDKNIEYLKDVKNRGIIIAVDTALLPLIKREVNPDFVVSIDPIEIGYDNVFAKFSKLNIPLLYSLGVYNGLIENYSGPKIIGLSKDDLIMDYLNEELNIGQIATGGSVASAALDFAVQLGGNPIIMVGQDFAFGDDNLTHSSDTYYQKSNLNTSLLREVEGIKKKKVYTSTDFYLHLRYFERYIAKHSDRKYIDATEGGAKIKGTEISNLHNVINNYCSHSFNKDDIIYNIINNYKEKNLCIEDLQKGVQKKLSE